MKLLKLNGEGFQVGDIQADDLARMVGKPAFGLLLPDDRVIVIVGLTKDEARACVPGFLSPARLTLSAT